MAQPLLAQLLQMRRWVLRAAAADAPLEGRALQGVEGCRNGWTSAGCWMWRDLGMGKSLLLLAECGP